MQRASPDKNAPEDIRSWRLWYALLGGPAAWTVHLLVSYGVIYVACDLGWAFLPYLVTLATVLVALGAGVVGWRIWRQTRAVGSAIPLRPVARDGFVGFTAVLVSAFFAVSILVEGAPLLVFGPCV